MKVPVIRRKLDVQYDFAICLGWDQQCLSMKHIVVYMKLLLVTRRLQTSTQMATIVSYEVTVIVDYSVEIYTHPVKRLQVSSPDGLTGFLASQRQEEEDEGGCGVGARRATVRYQ